MELCLLEKADWGNGYFGGSCKRVMKLHLLDKFFFDAVIWTKYHPVDSVDSRDTRWRFPLWIGFSDLPFQLPTLEKYTALLPTPHGGLPALFTK